MQLGEAEFEGVLVGKLVDQRIGDLVGIFSRSVCPPYKNGERWTPACQIVSTSPSAGKPHLFQGGVFIIVGAIAHRAAHARRQTSRGQAENRVELGGSEAFHRASVDPQQRGREHELPESDVALPGRPFCGDPATRAVHQVLHHHVAITLGGFFRHAARLGRELEEAIDVRGNRSWFSRRR